MERRVILSRLLDKYESSKHLLQPGVSARRVMLRIDRKELPEYKYDEGSAIRDAYNNAAISLEKDGLVSVEWARPGRMSVIALNLPSLDEAYRRIRVISRMPSLLCLREPCQSLPAIGLVPGSRRYAKQPVVPIKSPLSAETASRPSKSSPPHSAYMTA